MADLEYKQDLPTIYAVHSRLSNASAPLYNRASAIASYTAEKSQNTLDALISPSTRASLSDSLRNFVVTHPYLSAFLALHITITGIPLAIFLGFAATTFLTSLITCVVIGTVTAFIFTAAVVGFALLFAVPIIFFAVCTATTVFVTGVIGLFLLRLVNGPYGGNETQIQGRINAVKEDERVQRAYIGGQKIVGDGLKVADRGLRNAVQVVDKYTGLNVIKQEQEEGKQAVLGRDAEGNVTVR